MGLIGAAFAEFSFILVISVSSYSYQLNALGIRKCSVKILAVPSDLLFTWSSFLYCQLAPRRLADLLSVQFGGKHPFLCALVEIIDFLLCLSERKPDLLFCQRNGVLVQSVNDGSNKAVCGSTPGFQSCADLPLDGKS